MFDFPSAATLYPRWLSAFRSKGAFDAAVPRNNVSETAKVMAGGQAEDFGRLDFIGRQAFVSTATGRWLEMKGAEFGITRRPAQPASGNVVLSASDAVAVAAGATFVRADGWVYAATDAAGLSGAGTLSIAVVAASNPPANAAGAVDGTGAPGNCDASTPLTILAGVSGAGAAGATLAVDSSGISGGLDLEPYGDPWETSVGTLRGRILWRMRNPPHGGAPSDYVLWASEVPGVTRVFVERRWRGPGTVRIFPLFDALFAGGIPDAARVQAVQLAIEAVAPSACVFTVAAAAALPVNIALSALAPDSAVEQASVLAELDALFLRRSRVSGSDYVVPGIPFLATPFTFSQSWIVGAVGNAGGEQSAIVSAPAGDVAAAAGQLPVRGSVTFP